MLRDFNEVHEVSGMEIGRPKTPFTDVRFEGKHDSDRSNVNTPEQSLFVGSGNEEWCPAEFRPLTDAS